MNKKEAVRSLIDSLGGPAELARTLNGMKRVTKAQKDLTTAIVSNWTYRASIPAMFHKAIQQLGGDLEGIK